LIQEVLKTIYKYDMLEKGDHVVIGVSGGPDSICLLHILNYLKSDLDLSISIAHIEHGFRGQASIDDAQFVKELGNKMGIEVFVQYIDVPKLVEESKESPEEVGRDVRYDFYDEILSKTGADKVALGHNLDDQIETILMRILRGTGTRGLGGIPPVRDDIYIRPLIETSREDIMAFLDQGNFQYRIDKTNLEDIYHRNNIRLRLIPYLEKKYNPNLKQTLLRMAQILRQDNLYLDSLSNNEYKELSSKDTKGIFLKGKAIKCLPYPIKTRVLLMGIEELKGSTRDISFGHVIDIIDLLENGTVGACVMLPEKMIVEKTYNGIYLTYSHRIFNEFTPYKYKLKIPGRCYIQETGTTLSTQVVSFNDFKRIGKDESVGQFDFDKIKGDLIVRNRRPGDRFRPLGLAGTKKLKDFFIDEKIPIQIRDIIPLLISGSDIAWVIGFRISDDFKINEGTRKILLIKEEKGEESKHVQKRY